MASKIITLQGLKEMSNKQLYAFLTKNKWDKESIAELLIEADIKVLKGLNLKQLVENYHDDICECIYEEYQNAF